MSGNPTNQDLGDYFRLPTTHEMTSPSIVSAMAICRQALPAQLEYPP